MSGLREDVEFESSGATLRGWLYKSSADPAPGIVMAHGLSAVKEMFLDEYATAFARAGFTTLVYDNFGFGASDGEPRQSPAPDLQLQGYRDGVAWLAAQPFVDASRIALWGSSLSGGLVITLAAELPSIVCAVAQVPNLGEGSAPVSSATVAFITEAVQAKRVDALIPAVTETVDGVGIMFADGAYDWFTRVAATRAPSWRNEILITGMAHVAGHRPIDDLGKARVPLLLIVAPGDTLTPPGPATRIVEGSPNVELIEIPGDHFDAYEAGFNATSQPAIDWFRKHLG